MDTAHDPACDGRHSARQRCNDALGAQSGERRFRLPWRAAVQDPARDLPARDDIAGATAGDVPAAAARDATPGAAAHVTGDDAYERPSGAPLPWRTAAPRAANDAAVASDATASPPPELLRGRDLPPDQAPDLLREALAEEAPAQPSPYAGRAWQATAAAVAAPEAPPVAAPTHVPDARPTAPSRRRPSPSAGRVAMVLVLALIALAAWSLTRPRRAEAPARA